MANSKGHQRARAAGSKWGERKRGWRGTHTGRDVMWVRVAQEEPCQPHWGSPSALSGMGSHREFSVSFTRLPGAGVWNIVTSSYGWRNEMLKVEVVWKTICFQWFNFLWNRKESICRWPLCFFWHSCESATIPIFISF